MKNKNVITLIAALVLLVALIAGGTYFYNANKDLQGGGGLKVLDYSEPLSDGDTGEDESDIKEDGDGQQETEISLAPDVEFFDKDGNSFMLSDFFGKPIVLNFWASWCGPCKSEMPGFDELYKEYGDDVHFIMLNVSDDEKTGQDFISQNGYGFPVYYDKTQIASYTYGASSIPLTFLINKSGVPYAYQIGVLPKEPLDEAIKILLEE